MLALYPATYPTMQKHPAIIWSRPIDGGVFLLLDTRVLTLLYTKARQLTFPSFVLSFGTGLSLVSDTRCRDLKVSSPLAGSIDTYKTDQLAVIVNGSPRTRQRVQLELIHDQLPLAVPCYDLVLVIELTVGRLEAGLRALPTPLT